MLRIVSGQFPVEIKGALPIPLVHWVSDAHHLTGINIPFEIVLAQDDTQWSITYQDKNTGEWRTRGGACVRRSDECVYIDTNTFWMVLKR